MINYFIPIIIIALRLVLGLLITVVGVFSGIILKIIGFGHAYIYKVFDTCRILYIFLFQIKIELYGKIPDEPGIIMANHRSYVDILLIPTHYPIVFVAKSSVKKWPLFGWGGTALDTVWVNRESKKSRQDTRIELKKRLENKKSVVIFPEGTTTKGPEILELKPGMFYTVAEGKFSVIAVAIEYKESNIAFVDNDLFIPHFIKAFSKPKIEVKVRVSEPFYGTDGDELKRNVSHWLTENTAKFREEWDTCIKNRDNE